MDHLPVQSFKEHTGQVLDLLAHLVKLESPSTNKPAVDQLGDFITGELKNLGGNVTIHRQQDRGNHVSAQWGNGKDGMLFLCHMDTVWEVGTLDRMPFFEKDGKLYGPGVADMKGGIALFLAVMRVLREKSCLPARPVTILLNSDEEIGSGSSRHLIESLGQQAAVVFCLEPGLSNGALKTARKGTGNIEIVAHGRAAHAGADHKRGRNAIEELAHHVLAAQKLTDYEKGTTVNVGVIHGGTRSNVVPDEAQASVDFRVVVPEESARLKSWTQSLKPVLDGTSINASLELNRPPMPRDALMTSTFQKAQAIAEKIGLVLSEGSTGGASDANFVAPFGVSVLDGLGVVGDCTHAAGEHLLISSIPEREALLAALLMGW